VHEKGERGKKGGPVAVFSFEREKRKGISPRGKRSTVKG